jgi:hypothetical protein
MHIIKQLKMEIILHLIMRMMQNGLQKIINSSILDLIIQQLNLLMEVHLI